MHKILTRHALVANYLLTYMNGTLTRQIFIFTSMQTVLNCYWNKFKSQFHKTIPVATPPQWTIAQLWLTLVFDLFCYVAQISSCQPNAVALRPQHKEACYVEVSNTPLQPHVIKLNAFFFNGTHTQELKFLMQLLPIHLIPINVNSTPVSRCSLF